MRLPRENSCNASHFVALLKTCITQKDLQRGIITHKRIAHLGLSQNDVFIGNALLTMYAKFGALVQAQEVFDELLVRNVVSWNALMTGYVQDGHGEKALTSFERMQLESFCPDRISFLCVLKACATTGHSDKGQGIHIVVVNDSFLRKDVFIGSALVDMYAKCDELLKAQEVFDNLEARNVVSWNALLGGYAEHGCGEEALNAFVEMQRGGLSPDRVTFLCALNACGSIGASELGQDIHAQIVREGLLDNLMVSNALLDMYVKCGLLAKAEEVFDKIHVQNVISWTTLILGYAEHGHGEEALNCFEQMRVKGISPNSVTFVCILKACSNLGAVDKGQEIHVEMLRVNLLKDDIVAANSLLDMYTKCRLLQKAQEVFDYLPVQNIVTWTTLIGGYAQDGQGEEALERFQQAQNEGVSANAATFVCVLKACGTVGATYKSYKIHSEIVTDGSSVNGLIIGTALVDTYFNCGMLMEAQDVFDELPVHDIVLWNTLIEGYAIHGSEDSVFASFNKMVEEGKEPNAVTFMRMLTTCTYAGRLEGGYMYFEAMRKHYAITPTLEHHTCLVDLVSRTGNLDLALTMAKVVPFSSSVMAWQAVLGACGRWGDLEHGRMAFEHATYLDDEDASVYVCMSNIFAAMGRHTAPDILMPFE